MQTLHSAIQPTVLGFQLPQLHEEIPKAAVVRYKQSAMASLAIDLVNIGVINPKNIPDTAETAADVLIAGLGSWFTQRTKQLRCVKFSISVISSDEATEMIQYSDGCEREFSGNPVLVLNNPPYEDAYEMVAFGRTLDKTGRTVLATALNAIGTASCYTIEIRSPLELYNDFCSFHWEGDWTETPTDKDARATLLDRMGEDGDIDSYLPSAVCPIFGFDLFRYKAPVRKQRWLRNYAATKKGKKVGVVARETAVLLDLIERVRKADASMPDMAAIWAQPIVKGCCLIYQNDDLVWQTLDDMVNQLYNSGEGSEFLGLAELPGTTAELQDYFSKLDLCLALLRQMDKLIGLVATPVNK